MATKDKSVETKTAKEPEKPEKPESLKEQHTVTKTVELTVSADAASYRFYHADAQSSVPWHLRCVVSASALSVDLAAKAALDEKDVAALEAIFSKLLPVAAASA